MLFAPEIGIADVRVDVRSPVCAHQSRTVPAQAASCLILRIEMIAALLGDFRGLDQCQFGVAQIR